MVYYCTDLDVIDFQLISSKGINFQEVKGKGEDCCNHHNIFWKVWGYCDLAHCGSFIFFNIIAKSVVKKLYTLSYFVKK